MIDPLFSEAWVHRTGGHVVLGRALHPLCALDLLALEAVNSPFLYDDSNAGIEDLILTVWILSNPHPKDCSLSNIAISDAGKKWVAEIANTMDVEKECRAVESYIRDYYSLPEMMRDVAEKPVTPLGCPWMLSTVVTICRQLHIPLYDAWTMAIGQLLWYRCSIEEMDSDGSRVIGPETRQEMKQATHALTTYSLNPGETIDAFCARTGISLSEAQLLLIKN